MLAPALADYENVNKLQRRLLSRFLDSFSSSQILHENQNGIAELYLT